MPGRHFRREIAFDGTGMEKLAYRFEHCLGHERAMLGWTTTSRSNARRLIAAATGNRETPNCSHSAALSMEGPGPSLPVRMALLIRPMSMPFEVQSAEVKFPSFADLAAEALLAHFAPGRRSVVRTLPQRLFQPGEPLLKRALSDAEHIEAPAAQDLRTSLRLCPVRLAICLIGCSTSPICRMASLISCRR
ncbi:hypothetical protein NKH98_32245 [Mesorhizobium sp. M0833]